MWLRMKNCGKTFAVCWKSRKVLSFEYFVLYNISITWFLIYSPNHAEVDNMKLKLGVAVGYFYWRQYQHNEDKLMSYLY